MLKTGPAVKDKTKLQDNVHERITDRFFSPPLTPFQHISPSIPTITTHPFPQTTQINPKTSPLPKIRPSVKY